MDGLPAFLFWGKQRKRKAAGWIAYATKGLGDPHPSGRRVRHPERLQLLVDQEFWVATTSCFCTPSILVVATWLVPSGNALKVTSRFIASDGIIHVAFHGDGGDGLLRFAEGDGHQIAAFT